MKKILLVLTFVSFILFASAQDADIPKDSPTGWKFGGALPAVAYDSDVGFRYGALANFYDWGDGTSYPNYVRKIYVEWSRTTKGSGVNRFQYDDKAFFGSKIRFTTDIGYYIEQALDFYGYNGYQSLYFSDYSNTESDDYLSRMYYRMDRRTFRGVFDFQFPINDKMFIYTGVSLLNNKMGSVDIAKLNDGKEPSEMLPTVDSVPGVYENYVNWGIISPDEANGGFVTLLKTGFVFDSRNNEALPTKGLWEEVLLLGSPGVGSTSPYLQLYATHRQYFNIIEKRLSFAYRIAFQGTIAGEVPYYMQPYYVSTKEIKDGIGGSKTVRGIMRNRVQADKLVFGNTELRFRVLNTKLFGQDFYIALSGFVDATRVITPYKIDMTNVPASATGTLFNPNTDDTYKIHLGYGGGIRFALNENFIVAVDYGMANEVQDGSSGLYIGLDWLF